MPSLKWQTPGDNNQLQQQEAQANQNLEQNANNLPDAARNDSIGKMMLAFMAFTFIVQQVEYFEHAISHRDPNTGKPKGNNPYAKGLTAEQKKQVDKAVNTWISLGDSGLWNNLYLTMSAQTDFSQQQQAYLVWLTWNSWTSVNKNKIAQIQFDQSWPASSQLSLASALAGKSGIPEMCQYMETYKFNGKMPPYGAGAEVVMVAINQKYPNLNG